MNPARRMIVPIRSAGAARLRTLAARVALANRGVLRFLVTPLSIGALLSLGACVTNNAVMEVELDVPQSAAARFSHVQLQVRRAADFPFTQAWVGNDPSYSLSEERPFTASVVTEDAPLEVNMRVRFCTNDSCSTAGADDVVQEIRFTFENPFYLGQRTFFRPDAAAIDPDIVTENTPTNIAKCDVEGCIQGDDLGNFCRSDGTHFCE